MSNAAKAIYGKLANTTGVTGLISNRIYPSILPQQITLPAVTYSQVNQPGMHASGRDPNIQEVRMEVSCYSTSFTQAQAVSRQVKAALQDYTGSTWLAVQRIFFDDETDQSTVDPESKQITYRVIQDFICWYST